MIPSSPAPLEPGESSPPVTYRASWVLPVGARPIDNGCVTVRDGRITFVGSRHDLPHTPVVDLGDAVLLPGLVNAHSHLELTAFRHALEGLGFHDWIRTLTRLRNAVFTRSGDVRACARAGIAEGLAKGITSYADTASMGPSVLEALRDMQVRGIVYQESFGPDPDPFTTLEPAMRKLRQQVQELRGRATAMQRIGVSPHAPYSVNRALYKAIGLFANNEKLPVAVHLAESADEVRFVSEGEGRFADMWRERRLDPADNRAYSPVRLLEEAWILRLKPLVIHAVQVGDDDVQVLKRHGCTIAHCPASNARFGHGAAPYRLWTEGQLTIGIGTDSVASNNRMDVLDEARLAVLMACARERSPSALTAHRAVELCTMRGAQAIGVHDQAGTIAPGLAADLACFPLDGWGATPLRDVHDALVHGVAGRDARMTMVAGRVLWLEGRHREAPRLEEDIARVVRLGQRLVEERATRTPAA